eukprot:scaffold256151_cov19-Tisochrysis_lutea.AAC.1
MNVGHNTNLLLTALVSSNQAIAPQGADVTSSEAMTRLDHHLGSISESVGTMALRTHMLCNA